MQARVKANRVTATGTLFAFPTNLVQVHGVGSGAGVLTFKDGGSSGVTILVADIAAGFFALDIPEAGLIFLTDCHVTATGLTGLTGYSR